MSDAGAYSDRGDDYQRAIALKWAVAMLDDEGIASLEVQVTSLGLNQAQVHVDDIAIHYCDGRTCYLQCKKNQTDFREWRVTDRLMGDELQKAKRQLLSDPQAWVAFWSGSPFGKLQKLREYADIRPDYAAFSAGASAAVSSSLHDVAALWGIGEAEALGLWLRLEFVVTGCFGQVTEEAASRLRYMVNRADTAVDLLLGYIAAQSGKRAGTKHRFTRNDLVHYLAAHGVLKTPVRGEQDILEAFHSSSTIGRQWTRDIGGQRIVRQALGQVLDLIHRSEGSVLITDAPGSGKTCLLLDLIERLDADLALGVLFIKADGFADCSSTTALTDRGLPADLVGQAARLADFRQVIVVLDSLDVLSLNRANGALQVFLGILDQLEHIPNVTTIAACRKFDLQYDQHLKARTWRHVVNIGPLDWNDEVLPFLTQWGVDASAYNQEMKEILCNPRKLKLFEGLAARGQASRFESEQGLIQRYLEVVVLEDPQLGRDALAVLQGMAERMLEEHGQWLPVTAVPMRNTIRQGLLSVGVLVQGQQPGTIGFAHQTLTEGLAIQAIIERQMALLDFLRARPPLPTLRPVVRAFFFYLRAFRHDLFRRQVRAVFDAEDMAFHLKRLLAESLGEIQPEDEDWSLVRHLFQRNPELFQRFLRSTQHAGWLDFLTRHWLPLVKHGHDLQQGQEFAGVIERWIKPHPDKVVALWRDAFDFSWVDRDWLQRWLPISLDKLQDWQTDGVKELLEILLKAEQREPDFLGKALSRWVEANDTGDELLWSFIVGDVSDDDVGHYRMNGKLRCQPEAFHSQTFLAERMVRSEALLQMALTSVETWTRNFLKQHGWDRTLLSDTSWNDVRNERGDRSGDQIDVLMDSLDEALQGHARADSAWWRANVAGLRCSPELAIRYFVLRCCTEFPVANMESIHELLRDASLLRSSLGYEMGELVSAAFCLLDSTVQEDYQRLVLALYEDEADESGLAQWAVRKSCAYLDRVPAFLRLPEAQDYLDAHLANQPPLERQPYFAPRGGIVRSPIEVTAVLGFSDPGLLKLFRHYSAVGDAHWEEYQGQPIGGESQVAAVVREAASRDPDRFLRVLRTNGLEIAPRFRENIIAGVANHLRYRFGNLEQPQGWQAQTLPAGEVLAEHLLDVLESRRLFWCNCQAGAECVRACADTLEDEAAIERLVFLCFDFLSAGQPGAVLINGEEDLITTGINSVRGVAAEALLQVSNRLLEKEQPWPELLAPILLRLSRDSSPAVRAILIRYLPFLQFRQPAFGWDLFDNALSDATPQLWKLSERCLYYGYQQHFERVAGYLQRLKEEGMPQAAPTWGRIAGLASLAGKITQRDLLRQLVEIGEEQAWIAAAEVFSTNVAADEHHAACVEGVMALLNCAPRSMAIMRTLETLFSGKAPVTEIPLRTVSALLDAMVEAGGRYEPYHLMQWLAELAAQKPLLALESAECLIRFLERRPSDLWHKEPLSILLTTLFREAEDADDIHMIRRVVLVQDALLAHGAYGLNEWLRDAERS